MPVPLWRDVSNPFILKRTFEGYIKKHRNASIYISHLIACDVLPLPYFMISDSFSRHISELPCIHLLTFPHTHHTFSNPQEICFTLFEQCSGKKILESCYFLIKVSNGFPCLHGSYSQGLLSWEFWSNFEFAHNPPIPC